MSLKSKISGEEFNALSDEMKSAYKINAQMSYDVDLGGAFVTDKDPTALMTALEHERAETKKAKDAADRLELAAATAERASLTSVEELKTHYDNQFKALEDRQKAEKKEAEKSKLAQQQIAANSLLKQKALEISNSLFKSNAILMLPHIEAGLKAVPGDSPKVEIVDPSNGFALPDQNFDNWQKTLSTHPLYAPMIVVSNASGGSANDGGSSGSPLGTREDGKPKTYADYKPGELLALKREQPQLFQQLQSNKG